MSANMDIDLPPEFSDLERFVAKWDKPDTNERYANRLNSTMEEMTEFHDAVLPRIPAIKGYLDKKKFEDYSDADFRLARLTFAWVPVAEAVEVFGEPSVPDSRTYWEVVDEPKF